MDSLRSGAVVDGFGRRLGRRRVHELLYHVPAARQSDRQGDVSDSQLRFDKECSFRVYLYNTLSHPYWNVKLEVLSDQFEAAVVPSPLWKTYPDVQSAAMGGTREFFTVTLKRKSGVPDGQYDVSLRVYTSHTKCPSSIAFSPSPRRSTNRRSR